MTTNDERAEDPAAARRPADELPGQLPFDRLDVGDAEQLAELTGADAPPVEEPRQPVDERGGRHRRTTGRTSGATSARCHLSRIRGKGADR